MGANYSKLDDSVSTAANDDQDKGYATWYHFNWKYLRGEVESPKKFFESQKDTFPLGTIYLKA